MALTSLIFSARCEIDLGADLEYLDPKFFVGGRRLNVGRQISVVAPGPTLCGDTHYRGYCFHSDNL